MRIRECFEKVDLGDEHILIPVGDEAIRFRGVIALNEEAAYLIQHMRTERTMEELTQILRGRYDVDEMTARKDIGLLVNRLEKMGALAN